MMSQDADENVRAEPETPGHADCGEDPFPPEVARAGRRVQRCKNENAVTPCNIEKAVVANFQANDPGEREGCRGDCECDHEPNDHLQMMTPSRSAGEVHSLELRTLTSSCTMTPLMSGFSGARSRVLATSPQPSQDRLHKALPGTHRAALRGKTAK
jgi:hypothetical protein